MPIPIVDLFAGPGGLNEGFSHLRDAQGNRLFRTVLSVEKDDWAHLTLELRALFRRLLDDGGTSDYYKYVAGDISREKLFELHPSAAAEASAEALKATLGASESANLEIEDRVQKALGRAEDFVLIGGPPCQAYSLVGRARRKHDETFEDNEMHLLYREYLRIVNRFQPAMFLMENVPGLLSAKHKGARMFEMICRDLRSAGYDLYPIGDNSVSGEYGLEDPRRFVVAANEYGLPQSRSRVFILGLRSSLGLSPANLERPKDAEVTVKNVLSDLPRIRSRLTREADSAENWRSAILELSKYQYIGIEQKFYESLEARLAAVHANYPLGGKVLEPTKSGPERLSEWYLDAECRYVLNHNSRGHMRADLKRYFYWAQFASYYGYSPKLSQVPHYLRPKHVNISGNAKNLPFEDRFRVQLHSKPSTTVVSHIAKDGHYYIHYEPKQCRSLSVREAARLQTFPDNYFFEGGVTEQYQQVGNAVPPYLAKQIAGVVQSILRDRKLVKPES